ncbi:MAG: ACT domain-containing protein, partial [Polyangiaceae bacterium]|nr:ACT domain-containing protein [Polyangiaceae bacterium]
SAKLLQPYLKVARKIGSLLGQLDPVDVTELRVTCSGQAGELGVTPIAHAALAGYLEQHLEEPVNPISAPYEAKERGIALVEVREETGTGYASTIRVTIKGNKGIHTATGAIGNDQLAHLVGLDGYTLDAVMQGHVVLMRNLDRPGVIGAVGTVLGRRNINVSRMQVGLDESTGQALALYNVNSELTNDALDELRGIENVSTVFCVEL